MKYRPLGTTDIRLSSIIMGTWQAGKSMWTGVDDGETLKAMRAAFDQGITTFDTAEVYGNGHSEKIVGKALEDIRDQVVLLTKVFPNHFKYGQVVKSCEQSLRNLRTDYVDLYQIHWPTGSFGTQKVAVEETMRAMNDLKEQGKIRAIGVSNFSKGQIEEASGFGRIDSLQPPYSLFWRQVEKETVPYCVENSITVLAYSSMAQGILTGKFGPDHRFEKGDHRAGNRLFQPDVYPHVQEALGGLQPLADQLQISLGQLALAWVVSQPRTCAIAGARNSDQAAQNARAGDVELSVKILEEMDEISRTVIDYLDDDPLLWKF